MKTLTDLINEIHSQLNEVGYQPATGSAAASSAGGRPRPVSTVDTSRSPRAQHPGTKADVIQRQNISRARDPKAYDRAQKVSNRPLSSADIERTPEGRAGGVGQPGGRGFSSVIRKGKELRAQVKKMNETDFKSK